MFSTSNRFLFLFHPQPVFLLFFSSLFLLLFILFSQVYSSHPFYTFYPLCFYPLSPFSLFFSFSSLLFSLWFFLLFVITLNPSYALLVLVIIQIFIYHNCTFNLSPLVQLFVHYYSIYSLFCPAFTCFLLKYLKCSEISLRSIILSLTLLD